MEVGVRDRLISRVKEVDRVDKEVSDLTKRVEDHKKKASESQKSLLKMATTLSHSGHSEVAQLIQDVSQHHEMLTNALQETVLERLLEFSFICRNLRDQLKRLSTAIRKEESTSRNLERLQHQVSYERLAAAQAEASAAKGESIKAWRAVEQDWDKFQEQHASDMQAVLTHFAHIQLNFHAHALETYTKLYNTVANRTRV